jgi:urate oxidase
VGVVLGGNRYGKSGVRLVRVTRGADRHELVDLTVDVALEGDFTAAHVAGDNSAVLPTDTMRGTVYAFAGEGPVGEPEAFGLRLAGHFVDTVPAVGLARVSIVQAPWERIEAGGAPHRHAFVAGGGGRRTATVTRAGGQAWVVAGLADLLVLKTTGSGFEGFLKDGYTTLAETDDRILATVLEASWRYATLEVDWAEAVAAVRRLLLETFAGHDESRSVQHTLWAMGEAVLDQRPEVAEVRMTMPNKHHLLVDLAPYGLDNAGEVFVATDRPFGLIEGTVTRDDAPPAGRAWE